MSPTEPPRRGLGKGLSALLGPISETPSAAPQAPASRAIPVGAIEPGAFQPRRVFDADELAGLVESVKAQGVLQPILVRRHPQDRNRYQLVAGERRWRAAQAARLHEIPAVVRDLSDREALEAALVENLQRQDLNALEEADAFKRLIDEFGHTQEVVAQALGKSRAHIANTIRLLALPDEVKRMLARRELEAGKLYGMIHPNASGSAATRTASDNATVRNVLIIGPDKKIKLIVSYPMSTGRNFDEILRVIDSLQLTATKSVATPANWKQGEDVIILASVTDEAAKEKFPAGWKTLKPYLRMVPQPGAK